MAKGKLSELDLICRRYGALPSDMIDLDLESFSFNILVAGEGLDREIRDQNKAIAESKRKSANKRGR